MVAAAVLWWCLHDWGVVVIGLVNRGRAAAERLMFDTCTITRPGSGDPVRNPDGTVSPPPPVVMYEGPCRVKAENAVVTEVEAGGREVGVVRWTVSIPVVHPDWDTSKVGRGQTVNVTVSALDAGLVGRSFTVGAGFVGSQVTARRLPVEAVAL